MTRTRPSRIARWMIWIVAGLLSIDIYTLTGAAVIAVIVLVVGVLVGTAVGRLAATRSGARMNLAVSVIAVAALVVLVGSVWALANVERTPNSDSDGPRPLEAVAADAEVYRAALAEGDLEAYRHAVGPKLTLGVTLEDTFEIERDCLDWTAVAVSVAPHAVSSSLAEVTFSASDRDLVRTFQYLSGRWVVTVDANC